MIIILLLTVDVRYIQGRLRACSWCRHVSWTRGKGSVAAIAHGKQCG